MKTTKILAALLGLALLCGAGLGAQAKATIVVQSNVPGAQVWIDGRLVGNASPTFSIALPLKTYPIKVTKSGYQDFSTTINLGPAGVVVQATLIPIGQKAPAPTPPPAPAPTPAPPGKFAVSINANAPGATIIMNGTPIGMTPYTTALTPGSYNFSIRKTGYLDYNQTVLVNGPVTINATLTPVAPPPPAQVPVQVGANVPNAEILVNGASVGRSPATLSLVPGTYAITVRAPGYGDYNQTVLVNGPTQVNAMLQAVQVSLQVTANIPGADVYLNGSLVGKAPLSIPVGLGSYTVTVKAFGYGDFTQSVMVNGPTMVNAVLANMAASWLVNLPDALINRDMKGGHWSQIQIYLDGVLQKGNQGQIMAGRHVIRITSGAVQAEVSFDAQPGKAYTFEPFMGIQVR